MSEHEPMDPASEQPSSPSSGPDWSQARAKLTSVTGADRLILVAGLVFFVDSFLPWYGIDTPIGDFNVSGWDSGALAIMAILLSIAATAFAAARVLGWHNRIGDLNDGVVYAALGVGAFGFAVFRLLTQDDFTKYGLYVAIVAGAVLAVGGYQKFQASK